MRVYKWEVFIGATRVVDIYATADMTEEQIRESLKADGIDTKIAQIYCRKTFKPS